MSKRSSSATAGASPVCIYMLGPLRIERDKKPIHITRRKVESLLAYLVLHPEAHSREQLAALFWGDSTDEQARASFRTSLNVLRKELGAEIVLADRETVQLNPDFPLKTDIHELERRARTAEPAIDLYRGDLLAEFYDDWITSLRERYRDLYLSTLLNSVQALRSASQYERAIDMVHHVLAIDPASERAYQHLMFCQVALGNRPAAMEAYEQCARALKEELAVEPSRETTALAEWIKQAPAGESSLAAGITNLPIPLTQFIGRGRELATVKSLLTPHAALISAKKAGGAGRRAEHKAASTPPQTAQDNIRLVTLTGAGGSGKTRLAVQVGTDLIDSFSDGVWWIELAVLNDPGLVPKAFAQALGVREEPNTLLVDSLESFLHSKQALIVLDNCEHLVEACASLCDRLLSTCPHLKMLATSREALGIGGEFAYQVPTLSIPDPTTSFTELLLSYESIRLFVERARAARPDYVFTERDAGPVIEICQRLDGIPLAIELAAARVNVLAPAEIAVRLNDRFALLTTSRRAVLPRQQTLRALIDWSYDLLSPAERLLMARLAVFSGGRNLDAAEAVCAGDGIERGNILDLLSRLVAKSLVVAVDQLGETRYGFLDTIKAYALDKLKQSGEEERVRARQLEYFMQVADAAHTRIHGPEQREWLRRLETEHNNMRAALRFALLHEPVWALKLAATLAEFWEMHGHVYEGREWFGRVLKANPAPRPDATPEYRRYYCWAAVRAAQLAIPQADYASAQALGNVALELFRGLDDKPGIATALNMLATVIRLKGEYEIAVELHQESLDLIRSLGDLHTETVALNSMGIAAHYQGDLDRALALFEESLRIERELKDPRGIAIALTNVGSVVQLQGDYERARALHTESLALLREIQDKWSIASALSNLGMVAEAQADYSAARAYYEEALVVARELGEKRGMAILTRSLGLTSQAEGDLDTAWKLHEESLAIRREMNHPRGVCLSLANLGSVALMRKDYETARRLYSESLALRRDAADKRTLVDALIGLSAIDVQTGKFERGTTLASFIDAELADFPKGFDPIERGIHGQTVAIARTVMDPVQFDAAWQDGVVLTLQQAIDLALTLGQVADLAI